MNILAHRGWWSAPADKNTLAAFKRAFDAGYGIETDVRDNRGVLVIAHDMSRPSSIQHQETTFDDLLDLHQKTPDRMLALNIKADGLASTLKAQLETRGVQRYFVFDMSVPDTLPYLSLHMPAFTRWSDLEGGSPLDTRCAGVWLDSLETPFVPTSKILAAIELGKSAAVASPELHRKPHEAAWRTWKRFFASLSRAERELIQLCTDFPDDAQAHFS